MQKIFEEAIQSLKNGQPCVLATIIKTRGSAPQKAGAKMLVKADGSIVGTLGGGCVEGDIWYLAKEALKKKEKPFLRRYKLNEEMAARDGLVCGGTMSFFIEPLFSGEDFLPVANAVLNAFRGGDAISVATVVKSNSETRAVGSKIQIGEDGNSLHDFSDGEDARKFRRIGQKVAAFGENELLQLADGSEIFIEGFTTTPTLIIMGGGHVGKAVSQLAAGLGFRLIIVDDREEYADPERFPEAEQTIVADFSNGLTDLPINQNTYILVATRGHRFDDIATAAAVDSPARYVGLLGSKRKSLMIYKNLAEKGISVERIQEIRSPVGVDIGALTPSELAVSIMAEIIAIRRGGSGGFMKMDMPPNGKRQ